MRRTSCTRCTRTSCCPATPRCRSSTTSTGVRDGRSFATRRVVARQHGRPIYYLTANFQKPEDGFEHQDVMPDVIPPEEGIDLGAMFRSRGAGNTEEWEREWAALDVRYVGNSRQGLPDDPSRPARAPVVDPGQRGDARRPDPAPGRVHLRQRHDAAGLDAGRRTAVNISTPACRSRPSTTRSGSTGRSARTSGGSTTRTAPPPPVGAASRWRGSSRRDGTLAATVAQEGLIRHRG